MKTITYTILKLHCNIYLNDVRFFLHFFSFVKVKANQFGEILSLISWITPHPLPQPSCFLSFKLVILVGEKIENKFKVKEKCKQQQKFQKN
jgi:hypothetical protein